jgi:caffeoyl-CoA O-methyltransferase
MRTKHIPVTDLLYDYFVAQRSDANEPVLASLQVETERLGEPGRLAITPDQASLISLLVCLTGTKYAVEVGTFTGIASIAIARHLLPGGKLYSFDQDFKYTSMARRYWIKAGVQDRIDLRLGDARRLLPHFRPQHALDFVYIDADKESYDLYYEHLCPFVRTGGLIIFDNMLRSGQVADPVGRAKPINRAIDALNRKLAADSRVQAVLVPACDGLMLCRKLPPPGDQRRNAMDSRRVDNLRLPFTY